MEIENRRKMKMSKKMIPSLLCAGIIASMTATPMYAKTASTADERQNDSTVIGKSGVETSKSVVLNDDGTYTVDIEAYSTGSTAISQEKRNLPLDVVLVMDQSGSLSSSLSSVKEAAKNFVQSMVDNANDPNATEKVEHRVAIVGFAGTVDESNMEMFTGGRYKQYQNLTDADYQDAFMSVTDASGNMNSTVTTAINGLEASGGTRPEYGMKMANSIFQNNPESESRKAQRIVVLFTDGEPKYYTDDPFNEEWAKEAVDEAYISKNTYNSLVYTIGYYKGSSDQAKMTGMMNLISSNYPQGQVTYGEWFEKVSSPIIPGSYYVDNAAGEKIKVSFGGLDSLTPYWVDDAGQRYYASSTAFYKKNKGYNFTNIGEASSNKYYLTSGNVGDLSDIFQSISSDVTMPSTEIKLGADSVIRDVIEKGFKTTPETKVTYEIYKGTADANSNITFDRTQNVAKSSAFQTQNASAKGITAAASGQNVDVKGFNFSENYVAFNHDGYMIKITVTGILPDEENAAFNQAVYTNGENSGIYPNADKADSGIEGIKFERPTTYLADKAYVVDYAKRISMAANDWKLDTVSKVAGNYQNLSSVTAAGLDGLSGVQQVSGKFAVNDSATASYTPMTTNWTKTDKFFAFGKSNHNDVLSTDINSANGNLWSRVSVVPANSVYYEDTFVKDDNTGRVGIEYTGAWKQERTGTEDYTTSGVHGQWADTSVADSDGTYHVADVANKEVSKASYTFTGTGTAIYSRTNMESGTIMVKVTSEERDAAGKLLYNKGFIVDTKSLSSGDGSYYTIPTFSVMDLPYGKYNVKLTVTAAAVTKTENRTMYYLDGIRVYNPLNDGAAAKDLDNAYAGEFNAQFYSVKSLDGAGAAVFIDEVNNVPTVGDYKHPNSPANEVYLDNQQAVVVKAPAGSYDKTYIGLKSPDGKPVSVQVNGQTISVTSTMDQYWEVTPDTDGNITVKNNNNDDSTNLLAVTNIRTAYNTYQESTEEPVIMTLSSENALNSYQTFMVPGDNGENVPDEDVEIDNGDDDEVDSDTESKSWWEILFGGIFGWFH